MKQSMSAASKACQQQIKRRLAIQIPHPNARAELHQFAGTLPLGAFDGSMQRCVAVAVLRIEHQLGTVGDGHARTELRQRIAQQQR
jgi:hypothetical protein